MAVEVNKVKNASTIAFTLPISCQICLGKVKSPLLCPNNHVFCSQCLEIWLERNKQCPACRTPIDEENPCREIRGGVSVVEEQETNSMNTSELRRARFEMLFKDYESEMCLVEAKMEALKVENKALLQQLEITKSSKSSFNPVIKEVDIDALGAVTKKLEEVTYHCDKVKQAVQKYKKSNGDLKEENDLLLRENQRLRMELSSRSPHRYGRTTVAALQSQIDTYEKEVQQLNKALEKSDVYIEDLEKELSIFRGKEDTSSEEEQRTKVFSGKRFQVANVPKSSHKKQLFKDDTNMCQSESSGVKYIKSGNGGSVSPQKGKHGNGILVTGSKDAGDSPTKGGKKVTFSLPQEDTPQGSQGSSFDLEYPSPFAKSPVSVPDKVEQNPSTEPSTSFMSQSSNPTVSDSRNTGVTYSSETLSSRQNEQNSSSKIEVANKDQKLVKTLDDTIDIETELDDLDISVTPEIKDCMKLFNMAERNVQQRSSLAGSSTNTDVSPEQLVHVARTAPQKHQNSTDSLMSTSQSRSSSKDHLESTWKEGTGSSDFKNNSYALKSAAANTIAPIASIREIIQSDHLTKLPRSQSSTLPSGTYSNSGSYVSHQLSKSKDNFAVPRGVESFSKPVSHSVVSSILCSNEQTASKHSTFTSESSTSFLSHSQSNPSSSILSKAGTADFNKAGVNTTTGPSSQFSQSLLLNSKNTESLANSLMKLEQTLAAHRATNIPKPSNYQIPAFTKSVTASSSALSSTLPPPLLSQAGSNFSSTSAYGSKNSSVNSLSVLNPSYHNTDASGRPSASPYVSANPTFNSVNNLNPLYNTTKSASRTVPSMPPSTGFKSFSSAGPHQYNFSVPQSNPSATSLSNSILNGYSFPITRDNSAFQSGLPVSSSNATSSLFNSGENSVMPPPRPVPVMSSLDLEKPNNFSYVSNLSLNSNDLSSLDNSYLPEPKKRLFETDTDDTDMSFSPSKSSKLR